MAEGAAADWRMLLAQTLISSVAAKENLWVMTVSTLLKDGSFRAWAAANCGAGHPNAAPGTAEAVLLKASTCARNLLAEMPDDLLTQDKAKNGMGSGTMMLLSPGHPCVKQTDTVGRAIRRRAKREGEQPNALVMVQRRW